MKTTTAKILPSVNFTGGRAALRGMARRGRFFMLLVLALVSFAGGPFADSRVERPFQVQVDLSGVSVGYHFSELVYVGYTQQGRVKTGDMGCFGCEDDKKTRIYDQNRVDEADFTFGVRRSLEARFSPWPFGLYFSVGLLSVEPDEQRIVYEEAPRVVGDTAYNDAGLELELRSKRYTGIAAGMGINHVFESGLSIGAGFLMGLTPEDDPDVTASSSGSDPASAADLAKFERQVKDEYLDFPPIGMLRLAIGYNF